MNKPLDPAIEEMRRSRGAPAELKLKLINLKSELPGTAIFVFEGDDDRSVYFSWARYLDSTFKYEPMTCQGKKAVLELKKAVDRDVGSLKEGVFFFVDRDFDDLSGLAPDENIYMTECYSIENELLADDVIDEILKIEFHCYAAPAVRAAVIQLFNRLYDKFLVETRDINRELHAIRKFEIALEVPLPRSIGKIVAVGLEDVVRDGQTSSEILRPVRPVTDEEFEALRPEFDAFEARQRYRGKFALLFLMKWLEVLANERSEQATDLFVGMDPNVKVHYGRLSISTLASRSRPPMSFSEFFEKIPKAA